MPVRKTSGAKTGRQSSSAHAHDGHDETHDHVEFTLSKKTAAAIDAALKGLTDAQRDRVLKAIDLVGEEAGDTVGQWVEENVVANANELFAALSPVLAKDARWSEIAAIHLFLEQLDVPVNDEAAAKAIRKAQGAKAAGEYRKRMKG